MLRKALQGAAVTGAAVAFAVGAASPAMANNGSDYVYDPDHYEGIDILSNFCLDISDIVQLVDVDVLNGGISCDFASGDVHANGNDVDVDSEDGGWGHHKDQWHD